MSVNEKLPPPQTPWRFFWGGGTFSPENWSLNVLFYLVEFGSRKFFAVFSKKMSFRGVQSAIAIANLGRCDGDGEWDDPFVEPELSFLPNLYTTDSAEEP